MLNQIKTLGNAILCVAGFSIYFLGQSANPVYSTRRIACDETLTTSNLVVNFNCDIQNQKKLVTLKHTPENLEMEVKSNKIKDQIKPEIVDLRSPKQEIEVDEKVEEVELTITDPDAK